MQTKRNPWIKFAAALGALALIGGSIALSQTGGGFDLSWFSVDGGGRTSMGGGYALTGVIGQSDAGVMTGGGYTLSGGFLWNGGGPVYSGAADWRAYPAQNNVAH